MDYPKVSVVTVSYNGKGMIEDTIKSVLSQDYPNLEYIVIDGGSSDGTVDIIKQYQDDIAFWSSEPDSGIYDAMNKGLKCVSGDWVNFMNVGDTFANNNVLRDIFNAPINEDVRVIYGNTLNYFGDRTSIHKAESASVLRNRLAFSHQASLVRNLPEIRFDLKYKIASDYNMFYSILDKHGENAFLRKDVVVAKYIADQGYSLSNEKRMQREYLMIRSRHKNIKWFKDYLKFLFSL